MQVSAINNQCTKPQQSFTGICNGSGAEDVLRRVLKPQDWLDFSKIIEKQKDNPVYVILFGHGKNRLEGRIVYTTNNPLGYKMKDYTQLPFIETPMKFINKLCQKADAMYEKIKSIHDVNIDDIIKSMKS